MKAAKLICLLGALLSGISAFAQNAVTAILLDSSTGEPVSFATVSLTAKGAKKPAKYILSDAEGKVNIANVKSGTFTFKAELMGYKTYSKEITLPADSKLGEIGMKPDREQLEAAQVSATGNPIIIKKDTIEYNATSFKTTENDVLEDLLKKLPGVEVSEDGGITVNGETIKKITIDGKTFFLDDPTIASKNIPAKIINKLKVIEKKSEQAEFTGIDDGEEEHVIDLSIKPGMMKGAFGNIMGGAGHDIPSTSVEGDWRYQGAGFIGKFTGKQQLSLLLNANNTNNRGFNDLAGSMMGNMRGGGGRGGRGMGEGRGGNWNDNGITTSYMAGVNGAWDLLDDRMNLGGNYMFTHTDKDVTEDGSKTTYMGDHNMIYDNNGSNSQTTYGNRFGVRLEHKFSENTSILFEPQINFGGGSYAQTSSYTTQNDYNGTVKDVNRGNTVDGGSNKNVSTSGFFLLRQRLGIPGRTLTAMTRYSFSNNDMSGINKSNIDTYDGTKWVQDAGTVDQTIDRNSKSTSIFGRVTYTEPLGGHFYVEANYGYTWSNSTSERNAYDLLNGGALDATYSNNIINRSSRHDIGANMLFQTDAMRAQLGFSAKPTHTYNETTRAGVTRTYVDDRWKFAPQGMLWWEMGKNANMRMFYSGSSEQPSTSQLMPVPDNTDPLNISFGNPSLAPYFSHNFRGEYRYNNKRKFTSVSVRFNGNYVQNPIVSALWYGSNGAQYTMPFNGPSSFNAGINGFANIPIAKSNFSISNMTRVNFSKSTSLVGGNDFTSQIGAYYNESTGEMDYDGFLAAYNAGILKFTENTTRTLSATERLRVTYRSDDLELTLSGRTRMNKSWYTIDKNADNTLTWNNQVRATANWTWDLAGLTIKSEFNYNWYAGYASNLDYTPEYVLNAEILKLLFKKKVTLGIKGYDILGQAKNLSVTDNNNFHSEVVNNTLGRYIIVSITYRFGTFDKSKMRGGPGGFGGGRGGYGGGGYGGGRR